MIVQRRSTQRIITEQQRIALGFRPSTLPGVWFWLWYWSPPALWWVKRYR